jgi:rfaE bifunctional protein nucleotidyltransferase chain/domain
MIIELEELKKIRNDFKQKSLKVVFTNGCFDILHSGHVDYLNKAKILGDILIVGLNTDNSIRRIKGNKRPIINQEERSYILSNLKPVDYVCLFDEDTPENIIDILIPDILVKGSDWSIEQIVGRNVVEQNGGKVITIDFINNQSTSNIINIILERYK